MPKKIFFLLVITIHCLYTSAQSKKYFEGKITYGFSARSNKVEIPDKLLAQYFGSGSVLYFKEGNYKHEYEGGMIEYDLYRREDNKMYLKKRNNDTIYWSDCSKRGDTIKSLFVMPGNDTVLGIVCSKFLIHYNDKSEIHSCNASVIRIDPAWFENYKMDDEYLIDRKEKSIYLRSEMTMNKFTLIQTATEISEGNIDMKKFDLPANAILAREE